MNTVFVPKKERKQKVLDRFNAAYEVAGKEWRRLVWSVNPELRSYEWGNRMNALIGVRKTGERLDVEHIEVLTDALEKALGINANV